MFVFLAFGVKRCTEKGWYIHKPYSAFEHRMALGMRPEGGTNATLVLVPRGWDTALGRRRVSKPQM